MKTKINLLKERLSEWLGALNAASAGLGVPRAELRLPRGWPETNPSIYWSARSGEALRKISGHEDSLTQLPPALRAAPVHVWTSPGDTLLTRTKLPTRSRARILQALPFALEDQLLDEPEKLHFAYVRMAEGDLAVAVTQRGRLNVWLDLLRSAGIRPASVCPANLALPLYPQAWSVAFVDDELWVRSGEYAGFVCAAQRDAPPPLLLAALKEAGTQGATPQRLIVFAPPPELDVERWSTSLGVPVMTEATDFWEHARAPALNLLQADFGQAAHLQQIVRPLRPAAIMLAGWLVAVLVIDTVEWIRLRQTHNTITAEMHEIYRQSFGSAAQAPYEQMKKGLELMQARGGPGDMLPLLGRIAPALQAQGRVKIQGVKYSERSLTLELSLPDSQSLDAMKNALQAANLDVEVIAATGRGNEFEGRLRIQAGGSKTKPGQRS